MLISLPLEMGGGYMNNELLTSGKIVLISNDIMPKYDVKPRLNKNESWARDHSPL
jgi:hypothetical protein